MNNASVGKSEISFKSLSFYDEFEVEDFGYFDETGISKNPSDYYFAVDRSTGETTAVITPKKLWDEKGLWADSGYILSILIDQGFLRKYYDIMDVVVAPRNEDMSDAQVREDLVSQGFVENGKILLSI